MCICPSLQASQANDSRTPQTRQTHPARSHRAATVPYIGKQTQMELVRASNAHEIRRLEPRDLNELTHRGLFTDSVDLGRDATYTVPSWTGTLTVQTFLLFNLPENTEAQLFFPQPTTQNPDLTSRDQICSPGKSAGSRSFPLFP